MYVDIADWAILKFFLKLPYLNAFIKVVAFKYIYHNFQKIFILNYFN